MDELKRKVRRQIEVVGWELRDTSKMITAQIDIAQNTATDKIIAVTGQAFYERFVKELAHLVTTESETGIGLVDPVEVKEIARKAAGLEDK